MPNDEQIGKGLYVKIGLDVSGILGGVGGVSIALNQALELFSKFEGVAQGFVDLANNAALMGKEIKDNARDLGLSTTEFQQWTHTAIAAGSSAEEITGSIRMMSVRMREAADPTSEMGRTLSALGVNVLDSSGKMRSMNDVLLDVFPALNALPAGFERNQAAMTLFGRGFTNIADLASMSRGELQQLIDQAPVFSDDKLDRLDAYNTKMQLLNEKLERTKALAGSELIGSFTTWGNLMDASLQEGQPLLTLFEKLNVLLEMTAEGFTLLGGSTVAFFNLLQPGAEGFGNLEEFDRKIREINMTVLNMRGRFAHPEDYEIDLDQPTKEFDLLGKEAAQTSKEVADLQRKMEDLYQSIIDSQLSTQEAEIDNADLIEANNKLYAERATAELQADPETSGGQRYADRVEEIDKKIARNILQINKNNQTINKDTTDIARAHEDLVAGMVAGDAEIVSSMAARVETTKAQYEELTQIDIAHWQTTTDLARVAYDTIIDYMVKAINFAGENPIIQTIIYTSSGGDFTPISAEPLPTVDFSKVAETTAETTRATTPAEDAEAEAKAGKSSGDIIITVNQTNYGVKTDAEGVNRSLGKIANLTGAGG